MTDAHHETDDRYRLEGQTVLVTGAGGGVGRGIALSCARVGANLLLAVRRPETGTAVATEIEQLGGRAQSVHCDVSVPGHVEDAVDAAVRTYGRLDHVVHNATSGRSNQPNAIEDVSDELWEDHSSVALRALHRLVRASFPHLERAQGSLLLLTSPAGMEGSRPLPLYGTVKAGQRGFLKALAREWGAHGIRVNGLAPLAVTRALDEAREQDPGLAEKLAALTPLGRLGDADADIGPPAVFLCSDAARYITGQTLAVSGGRFTLL